MTVLPCQLALQASVSTNAYQEASEIPFAKLWLINGCREIPYVLGIKGFSRSEAEHVQEYRQLIRTRGMIRGKIIDNILHFIFSP